MNKNKKNKFKTVIFGIMFALLCICIIFCGFILGIKSGINEANLKKDKIRITVSDFASYDFVRAIIGKNENVELIFLVGPGKDIHNYNPTELDFIKAQTSDLFVYVGGEVESWSEKVINTLDTKNTNIICLTDYVEKIEKEIIVGAETEEEKKDGTFDEHIWTSPENAKKMIETLEYEIEILDEKNADIYKINAENYIEEINEVDTKIKDIVDNKKRNRLVFADKMPMKYFINYYGLEVSAGFSGCSTESEPSRRTIDYLEYIVEEEKVPLILYLELDDRMIAETIANETGNGCKAMQIQTLHNVSKEDFENGETWVSLMTRNLEVLKKALQ